MLEKLRHLARRGRRAYTQHVRLTQAKRDERDRVLANRWERVKHQAEKKP